MQVLFYHNHIEHPYVIKELIMHNITVYAHSNKMIQSLTLHTKYGLKLSCDFRRDHRIKSCSDNWLKVMANERLSELFVDNYTYRLKFFFSRECNEKVKIPHCQNSFKTHSRNRRQFSIHQIDTPSTHLHERSISWHFNKKWLFKLVLLTH